MEPLGPPDEPENPAQPEALDARLSPDGAISPAPVSPGTPASPEVPTSTDAAEPLGPPAPAASEAVTSPSSVGPSRTWPEGRTLTEAESIDIVCASCSTRWRIHDSLRGFRKRCTCGAWIVVPAVPELALEEVGGAEETKAPTQVMTFGPVRPQKNKHGLVEIPGEAGEVIYENIPTDIALAPGTMRRASSSNQTRWTNRTILEFVLLMLALLGPQLVAFLMVGGRESELMLPLASLASGVLVACVLAWAGPFARVGLRLAAPRFMLEAVVAAGLAIFLVFGYVHALRSLAPEAFGSLEGLVELLGIPVSLLVIAVTPAVLEEIIFRGMLQGRLLALFGRSTGLLVTAVVFALAHGQSAALPIHIGLGLYLGSLRERAHSLLPGMVTHFVYNGTIVLVPF